MSEKPRYSIIPGDAVRDARLDGHAFKVLALVGSYGGEAGWMWGSQGWMAEQLGMSRPLVHRCLKQLEELGYVMTRASEKGRGTKDYKTKMDREYDVSHTGHVTHRTCHGGDVSRQGGQEVSHCVTQIDQEQINITSSSSSREQPSKNPTRVDWQSRLAEAHRIAEGAVAVGGGGTCHPAAFRRLCEPVKGEPCDWDLDVVPAIASKAASMRAKGEKIQNWEWTMEGALRNRDRRLAGLPAPEAQPVRMISQSNRESDAERIARIAAQNGWEAVA